MLRLINITIELTEVRQFTSISTSFQRRPAYKHINMTRNDDEKKRLRKAAEDLVEYTVILWIC